MNIWAGIGGWGLGCVDVLTVEFDILYHGDQTLRQTWVHRLVELQKLFRTARISQLYRQLGLLQPWYLRDWPAGTLEKDQSCRHWLYGYALPLHRLGQLWRKGKYPSLYPGTYSNGLIFTGMEDGSFLLWNPQNIISSYPPPPPTTEGLETQQCIIYKEEAEEEQFPVMCA